MPPKPAMPSIIEESHDNEHYRAQWWRVNVVKLTVQELADLTGYSTQAIYFMERGIASDGSLVKSWVKKRYRMACAGVQAQVDQGRPFEWQ